MKDTATYLRDILRELNDVREFTLAGKESFLQDRKTQKAVIRSYEIVGEIAKRLPASVRDASPEIGWRRLMGFRDFLAHHYEEVDLELVWTAVTDVHELAAAVRKILTEIEENTPDDERNNP